jgi:predicted DNA-binding transcriptional regulator YafY
MAGQNKQLMRMIRFVGELKQNNYPNCQTFCEKLRDLEYDQIDMACSRKTVQRDIKSLKDKYGAPIEFDYEKNGYYLKHHGWSFECPVYPEEDILSWVLGAKLASDIIPNPVSSQITLSIDELLTTNNPDFLDKALVNSIAVSGTNYKINPDVFRTVFQGWLGRQSLKIKYKKPDNNEISERIVDPHVLSFYNEAWYLKAYCHLRKDIRVFAVHRINEAELIDAYFEFKRKLMNTVKGIPFMYKEDVVDAELLCLPDISGFFSEWAEGKNYKFSTNKDGSINLFIQKIYRKELIRLVLSEGGSIKLLNPEELKTEIKTAAEKISEIH